MAEKKRRPAPHILITEVSMLYNKMLKGCDKIFREQGFPLEMDQIPVLMSLYYGGEISQQEMCLRLHRDKASINRTVAFLAERDMVKVIPDAVDKRKKRVALTPGGVKIATQADEELNQFGSFLYSAFTGEEKKQFHTLMQKLIETVTSTH